MLVNKDVCACARARPYVRDGIKTRNGTLVHILALICVPAYLRDESVEYRYFISDNRCFTDPKVLNRAVIV